MDTSKEGSFCAAWKGSTFRLKINAVDHAQALHGDLPNPWPKLREGFHQDLYLRIAAWNAWCAREQERVGSAYNFVQPCYILTHTLGHGYASAFNPSAFPVADDDPFVGLKRHSLNAVEELAAFYGDRLPKILWDTLAFIAVREAPTEDRSIIAEVVKNKPLPHHYTELDACLHALGKVYSLHNHVASVFWRHTGHVPIHNCDCGCSLHSLQPTARMEFEMPLANIRKATESFLTHLCAEFTALATLKLPFELGVGDDAAAAIAMERDGF